MKAPLGSEVFFVFENGTISVTSPDDRTLEKMQHVAKLLEARVIGEHGDDLTESSIKLGGGCASPSAQVFVVLAVLAVVAGKAAASWWN